MTKVEEQLQKILRRAKDENVTTEQVVKSFLDAYWELPDNSVSWDTPWGKAIHDLADDLEYFEPNRGWIEHGLFGEDVALRKITAALSIMQEENS